MLDRLRRTALNDEFEDEDDFTSDAPDFVQAAAAEEDLIFGLNPAQRLVLSIFLFLDISAIGCMLLLALGRINL